MGKKTEPDPLGLLVELTMYENLCNRLMGLYASKRKKLDEMEKIIGTLEKYSPSSAEYKVAYGNLKAVKKAVELEEDKISKAKTDVDSMDAILEETPLYRELRQRALERRKKECPDDTGY